MARVEVILIFSDLPMFLQAVPAIDYYSPVIAHNNEGITQVV
jgi:hypothetical protein